MSSTARGGKRSPADLYGTPAWPVHRLLERLQLPGGVWYEPAAGEGAIVKAVNQTRSDVTWVMSELREECRSLLEPLGRTEITSFFDIPAPPVERPASMLPAVCITNPPFSLAMEFIEHSLKFSPYYVIHLLRLNFLGTEKRNKFFQSNMPDVYVVPDRISFTGDGNADSIEYMWAVWGPERGRRVGKIEVLNTTPVEQRR